MFMHSEVVPLVEFFNLQSMSAFVLYLDAVHVAASLSTMLHQITDWSVCTLPIAREG